jgi:hypothetical protein
VADTSASGASTQRTDGTASGGPSHEAFCPVAFCPICTAVSAVNRTSPEVLQHLLLAGQQFLLALKAVIDARGEDFQDSSASDAEPSMEHIDIG